MLDRFPRLPKTWRFRQWEVGRKDDFYTSAIFAFAACVLGLAMHLVDATSLYWFLKLPMLVCISVSMVIATVLAVMFAVFCLLGVGQ